MLKTELILVRHGETEWNRRGRWQGHRDSSLTDTGRNQAAAVSEALSDYRFSAIYSSDLGRAMQTAEPISQRSGIAVIAEKRLRERAVGIFEGLTESEMKRHFKDEYERFNQNNSAYAVPGGESRRQFYERSTRCLNDIAQRHSGETVVVVAHGGIVNCMFRYVVGLSLNAPRTFTIYNGGINIFAYEAGQWTLLTFGETRHLNGVRRLDDA